MRNHPLFGLARLLLNARHRRERVAAAAATQPAETGRAGCGDRVRDLDDCPMVAAVKLPVPGSVPDLAGGTRLHQP
jgi:hypothetical protein